MLPGAELRPRLGVLEGLDNDDLEQQVAFIEGSLYAHLARETTASHPVAAAEEPEEDDPAGPPSDEAFVASALDPGGGDPVARDPDRGR